VPRFEVHVPAAPPAAAGVVGVEADHWLAALQAALGTRRVPSGLLCDVRPDGVDVADAKGGGVWRIREVRDPISSPLLRSSPPAQRGESQGEGGGLHGPARRAEDVLAELFERTGELDARADRASGLGFLLDLAMEKVDAEAGSVLVAPLGGRALEFAVVRGPRSREILRLGLAVPLAEGIAGFCVRQDVAVAVADATRDPRFHAAVSRAIGYETRSLLCAPIADAGHVLGAIEVLNPRGGRRFDAVDLAVVSYVAHAAARLLARPG
jgi:GAF domain-containing protein